MFFALVFILRQRSTLARTAGAAILLVSCALGYRNLVGAAREYARTAASMPAEYRPALVNWLNKPVLPFSIKKTVPVFVLLVNVTLARSSANT